MTEYRVRTAQDTASERQYIDNLNYDSFRVAFQLQENISDEEAYTLDRKNEDEDQIDTVGDNHIVFIAETKEGNNAGFIWLAKREPFYVFKEPLVWIYNINIEPPHRGKGLSKKLLGLAEKWTQKNGYKQIGLHVIEPNNVARRLYETQGYQQVAQHNASCFYLKTL